MILREGKVQFVMPSEDSYKDSSVEVFYNPHMAVNRDFTVLMLKAYSILKAKKLNIADPMCASGIRVLRLLEETDIIEKAYLNDIKQSAIKVAKENLKAYKNVEYFNEDANIFLYKNKNFDYIDIDPFGSPVGFLESAISSLKTGGLIGITATDTASISGAYPFKAIRRYGSKPLDVEFYHEVALRILIKYAIQEAFKLDYVLIPVFSFSYRHFLRAFFIKEKGVSKAIPINNQIGYIGYCHSCKFREKYTCLLDIPKYCPICGEFFDYGGPLYLGPLYDIKFLDIMLKEGLSYIQKDSIWLLKTIKEESNVTSPWFYKGNIFGKGNIPKLKDILIHLKATKTHFSKEGFKTDLDFNTIKEFFR